MISLEPKIVKWKKKDFSSYEYTWSGIKNYTNLFLLCISKAVILISMREFFSQWHIFSQRGHTFYVFISNIFVPFTKKSSNKSAHLVNCTSKYLCTMLCTTYSSAKKGRRLTGIFINYITCIRQTKIHLFIW